MSPVSGNNVQTTDVYYLTDDKPTRVKKFATSQQGGLSGIYKVLVNGPGTCAVQVRGSSITQVFQAFIQPISENGIHQDDAYFDPVVNGKDSSQFDIIVRMLFLQCQMSWSLI